MHADDLGGAGGVQRVDLVGGLDAVAADDQFIFTAKLAGDHFQGRVHFAGVIGRLEIDKRLIGEPALGRARLNLSRQGGGCHNELIVVQVT